MPCSKGMGACYAQCAHRRFVLDYTAERDAQLVRAESTGDDGQFHYDEFFETVEERLTFKSYLITHKGADYPYPRLERPALIDFLTSIDRVDTAQPIY